MRKILFTGVIALLFGSSAVADVQLVLRDFRGDTSEISSNGRQARIESTQMPGWAIVDYSNGEFLVVNPAYNEITSMRLDADSGADGSPGIDIVLQDLGSGARIAGYPTRQYRIKANGQSCGSVFASNRLLQDASIRGLFESMRSMQKSVGGISAAISEFLPVCQRANLHVSDAMGSTGVPMKVLDAHGQVVSEVVSVKTDVSIAPSAYQAPPGMNVVSAQDRMNQASQQLQQIPEASEIMQQLQQGGGVPPELQQQLQQQLEQLQGLIQELQQQ